MAIAYNVGVTAGTRIGGTDYTAGNFKFIPTFWSAKFIEAFYNKTVFGEIANTNYQGEISGMGDKVVIPLTPSIAISDYTIGGTLSYERPAISTIELTIDKAKSFAFKANDVEKMQAKPAYVAKFSEAAGEQMKVAIDSQILAGSTPLHTTAHADNVGDIAGAKSNSINLGLASGGTTDANSLLVGDGTSGTVDPYVILSRMATVLDEQNAPETDRWVVVPPLFRLWMHMSPKAIAFIQGSNEQLLRNGYIGQIDRFKVYLSNQLATSTWNSKTVTHIIAGHKSALTFASQMTKVETLRDQNDFGDLMRGLQVYGFKTIDPKMLTQASVRLGGS